MAERRRPFLIRPIETVIPNAEHVHTAPNLEQLAAELTAAGIAHRGLSWNDVTQQVVTHDLKGERVALPDEAAAVIAAHEPAHPQRGATLAELAAGAKSFEELQALMVAAFERMGV